MNYETLKRFVELVHANRNRTFEANLDPMCGVIYIVFHGGFEFCATPFYEDAQGIPVCDNEGGTNFELPFKLTGDLERDAAEYVRLVNMIPKIAGVTL